MKAAHDVLVATVEEQRPTILLLGQDACTEPGIEDPVLVKALNWLGRDSEIQRGWSGLLDTAPVPPTFYEWLSERFERRVHPAWVTVLSEFPWSAVFTSALDPTLKTLLEGRGREPEVILTASEMPRAIRSKARPPLYYLFGRAGLDDQQSSPPTDRSELNTRRVNHALPMLNRVLDTATTLGLVIIDGFIPGHDWLRIEDILGATGRSAPEQILWFGKRPELGTESAVDFDAAIASSRIVFEPERLGTVLSELRAIGRLTDFISPEAHETGIISFTSGRSLETTPAERLRVEAVASIVDDTWTAFLPPQGPDTNYDTFRRFHGDLGGARLLVEGIRRNFAIQRDFEKNLLQTVSKALADHASVASPIVIHGQSGTGKSVSLARVVANIREPKTAAVLYAIGRIPQPEQISNFCEEAEKAGSKATLIVCDANRDVDTYRNLLMSLRSRGRRVVVLGSRYRMADNTDKQTCFDIEAPSALSRSERKELTNLLSSFLPEYPNQEILVDSNFLAFLYRFLPPSRNRIASGLGMEAKGTEQILRTRGTRVKAPIPDTQLAQQLIEAGVFENYEVLFDGRQIDALASSDAPGRIIDLVMVAGSLNCHVPVNLLLRAVIENLAGTDVALVADMFSDLDLFRWTWADEEQSELLVLPRLKLEADLICRRRLGSPEKEAERLIELIGAVRGAGIDSKHERYFLLDLLQQIGDNGPRGPRYKEAYVEIARTLTNLRQHFGVIHASLILQESAFRRAAVRHNVVEENERLPLLEEAREAIQAALDGINNGTIKAARRTQQNLQGERASLYGFLAYDCAKRNASTGEIWSSYQAARTAIRQAVSVTDNYYPLDIGLWTPADILKTANFSEVQKAEIEADIHATLDQVDPEVLSPKQKEKFDIRRMQVGGVLQDHVLTEEAYETLKANGSTAGYFLRAREYAPNLRRDIATFDTVEDISCAKQATEFLYSRFEKIEHDERCLSLLLECKWIATMKRRLLRGERQPLPADDITRRDLLTILRALNQASGDAVRHVTQYLEAVLAWVIGDVHDAITIFKQLAQDTEYQDSGRVVRRHQITDQKGEVCSFSGRVERQRSEGHWIIRIDGLNQKVGLIDRDFPRYEIAYGRSLRFAIAFNYIGPIADPISRRR